ncbi:MAG: hypothetical protein PF590_05930 [Candidatus Delongbacteria bacterium]|nr:hypothetical protein [Candidatus Delongbacteria bacterium]
MRRHIPRKPCINYIPISIDRLSGIGKKCNESDGLICCAMLVFPWDSMPIR